MLEVKKGKWWMYKTATPLEMFSEIFISKLGIYLGLNMATYIQEGKYVKTLDFTNYASINFEPAYAFMSEEEDYIETTAVLNKLYPMCVRDYVQMLFLDTICANPDRHTFNFSVIRDVENGDILGLAPNFVNNMALISRGYPRNLKRDNDYLIKIFTELMIYDASLKKYIPKLTEQLLVDIVNSVNVGAYIDKESVVQFVMNGYSKLSK